MLINRRTFKIKPGRMEEAVKLIKDFVEEVGVPAGGANPRLSTAFFGAFDVLFMEVEHENLDHYQKYWNELFNLPAMGRFFETWNSLTEVGGVNELWEVM